MPPMLRARRFSLGRARAAFAAFAAMLALAPNALAAEIELGPVSVLNGTATLSGSVGDSPSAGLQLTVNGTPLGVDAASGQFAGTVNLAGQSALTLSLKNPLNGETATITIPINANTVGADGLIKADVLKSLVDAGINLIRPAGGFKILDGQPLVVSGSVLDKDKLASLTVNGRDVLKSMNSDGSFSQPVSGSSKEVVITATDRQGVSQTSSFSTIPVSSVINTSSGQSVSAQGANGVRITSVRYITKNIRRTGRVTMIVTVKDRRGLLVRGAKVRIRGVVRTNFLTFKGAQTKTTTTIGRATFSIKLNKRVLSAKSVGKRFVVASVATTPSARASLVTSFRVPAKRAGR